MCLHTIFPQSTNNKPINLVVTLTYTNFYFHEVIIANPGGRVICGRSLAGIAGSNHGRGMDVCLL